MLLQIENKNPGKQRIETIFTKTLIPQFRGTCWRYERFKKNYEPKFAAIFGDNGKNRIRSEFYKLRPKTKSRNAPKRMFVKKKTYLEDLFTENYGPYLNMFFAVKFVLFLNYALKTGFVRDSTVMLASDQLKTFRHRKLLVILTCVLWRVGHCGTIVTTGEKTEEETKVVAASCGTCRIHSIPCRTSYFAPRQFEEYDEFIIFFISSLRNSSFSSYHPR